MEQIDVVAVHHTAIVFDGSQEGLLDLAAATSLLEKLDPGSPFGGCLRAAEDIRIQAVNEGSVAGMCVLVLGRAEERFLHLEFGHARHHGRYPAGPAAGIGRTV